MGLWGAENVQPSQGSMGFVGYLGCLGFQLLSG